MPTRALSGKLIDFKNVCRVFMGGLLCMWFLAFSGSVLHEGFLLTYLRVYDTVARRAMPVGSHHFSLQSSGTGSGGRL